MTDRIRLGLIGAGAQQTWASRAHSPALQSLTSDIELVAVCTTKPESAERARETYGATFAFHDFRDMVRSPEIDAVAVVVRVPSHFEPTKAAIEAGKHVFTEWPLGRTTTEASELAALARSAGVRTAVGLQARFSPPLMEMKHLIESGFVGEVVACHVSLTRDGILERDSSKTWQGDIDAGANTLTIATGHVVDTLRYVAGDLERVASGATTQVRQWVTSDTGERVTVTSPDNVIIAGSLRSGAALSVHVAHVPWHGNGYRMEIYGDRGTLIATGQKSPQLTAVSLRGAQGVEAMRQIAIPTQTLMGGESGMPAGEGFNVAQLYREFAVDIRTGAGSQPTFDTAVDLHRIIDVIKLSSDTGSAISLSAGG